MGNKKGAQTKTESTTTASPEAMAAYRDILARATTEADKPYEAYTGDRVAGFSPDQLAAFQSTRDAQGIASPFLTEATGMARAGAAPIDAAAIARYQNPYQQSVIDTTMADLQRQNAIAQTQVTGNAALRGALGGSRVGVAQALTAGEQGRTQASTLANLHSGGYDRALAAAQQDRAASSSGASLMAGLGDASSTAAYRDVASLYGMGQQQQGNQQAGLDTAYQAWQQQQAFPTQQISWLSDVAGRAGTAMGSSTTGTKTDPAPNPWSAILGAAGTVAGAALGGPMGASIGGSLGGSLGGTMGGGSQFADGGVVPSYAAGGVVKGYEDGGIIDLASDGTGAWALPAAGAEAMPTEMAGTEGTPSGGFNWQSIGNPLMQAGLKMMSSTSPYLGVAIGEGGTAGMKAYGDNQKADADKKHKEAQLQLQRDRLGASLKAQREKLAGENWQYLGQGPDGAVILDKKSGTIENRPFSVTPRAGTGSASSGGAVAVLADSINADRKRRGLPEYTREESIARARRGRSDVETSLAIDGMAARLYGDGSRGFDSLGAARAEVERRIGEAEGRSTIPIPASPAAPSAVVPGTPPAAPAGPAVPPTTFRDPYDVGPGSPGIVAPLPRAVAPVAPPPVVRPAVVVPPRPPGKTDTQLKAEIVDAMSRRPADADKIRSWASAWGIRLD